MRQRLWITFCIIILLGIGAAYVAWPQTTILKWLGNRQVTLQEGLDLKGGVHLVYIADTSKISKSDVSAALDGVRNVFENRINTLGVTEPDIRVSTTDGKPSVIVDLPGVSNIEEATTLLGKTATLEFKDPSGNVVLTGGDIVPDATSAQPDQTSTSGLSSASDWEVDLQLTADGTTKFAQATAANIGKQISIYLDGTLIESPTVQEAITNGKAVITGNFTPDQAKQFVLELQSGALPVPVSLASSQQVGATLGADAISASVLAGAIGIVLILIFMIAYYRFCGVLACLALILYSILNVAVYKLLPVTMTLAGIAGFIISIGIAVDTNVLTFERLKEELRAGKPIPVAVQESFKRSWTSIRDSHLAGLITATIIFIFADTSVRGFALVLIIGTLLSLFSAITVTRNWMLLVAGSRYQKLLGRL